MIAALAEGADVEVRTKDGFVFRCFPTKKTNYIEKKSRGVCGDLRRFKASLNQKRIYIYTDSVPIGSMYCMYANIWGILMVNVTIYSIHGSYGIYSYKPQFCLDTSGWLLRSYGSRMQELMARARSLARHGYAKEPWTNDMPRILNTHEKSWVY